MLKYTRCTGVLPVIHFSFSNGKSLQYVRRFSVIINSKIELRKSLPIDRVTHKVSAINIRSYQSSALAYNNIRNDFYNINVQTTFHSRT